jgi:hypothetical protein
MRKSHLYLATCFIISLSTSAMAQDTLVRLIRWYHPPTQDWHTAYEGQSSDSWYSSRGYETPSFIAYAYKDIPSHDQDKAVKLIRWYHRPTQDWHTAYEGQSSDSWYSSRSYETPSFIAWGFRSRPDNYPRGYTPVKLIRWYHRPTQDWHLAYEGQAPDSWYSSRNYETPSFVAWGLRKN